MKKTLIILLLFLVSFGFQSCKDSLGIDDNVNERILDDDIYDENGYSKYCYDAQLKDKDIQTLHYLTKPKPNGEAYERIDYDVLKKDLKIDTTRGDSTLWLELDLKRSMDYVAPIYLDQFIEKFSLKISKAEYSRVNKINSDDKFNYLRIILQDFRKNQYTYGYKDVISSVEFYPDKNNPGLHYCDIEIFFPSRDNLSIEQFKCTVKFRFEN